MPWSQLTCAGALRLFGLGSLVYGSRAFAGVERPMWRYFLHPSRVPREPAPQASLLAALLAFLPGMMANLGRLGLIVAARL